MFFTYSENIMSALPSKQKLVQIRQSMEKALAAVAAEHGIDSFKLGNIRYDDSGFKVPVEAVFQGGDTSEVNNPSLKAGAWN